MSHMNVGSNYSQEYASQQVDSSTYGVDADGEGLVDVPRGGRSANYTAEEDVLLCKIGMDPATGTDQTKDTYWDRITDLYNKTCTKGFERTNRSLRSR